MTRRQVICLLLTFASWASGPSISVAGYLYVSNNSLNSINRYDSTTGAFIDRFISSGEGAEKFTSPKGLAIGSDGYLYVNAISDSSRSQIRRYDAQTGDFVDVFAQAEQGSQFDRDIQFGPDGQLYVGVRAQTSLGFDGIRRYDTSTGNAGTFASGLQPDGGMRFGPSGDLFALGFPTLPGTKNVLRLDGDTGASLGEFVSDPGFGTNSFEDVEFGPDGNLYVAIRSGSEALRGVRRYDGTTGEFIDKFADVDEADPYQLAFGPDGNLYVSIHTGDGKLKRYDGTTGEFIDDFVTSGPVGTDGWLVGPTGFVFSETAAVPEPSSLVLLGTGILTLFGYRLRRKQGITWIPNSRV